MTGQLDRILDDTYLADLQDRPTDEVRGLRAECEAEEEAVSYARRVLQGRLDILRAEVVRRRDADDEAAAPLMTRLPDILTTDQPSGDPLHARATRLRVPARADELESEVDALVDEAALGDLPSRDPDELAELIDRLADHEHHLSGLRRQLFDRIDALRAELAARYKDGRAAVSDLLTD